MKVHQMVSGHGRSRRGRPPCPRAARAYGTVTALLLAPLAGSAWTATAAPAPAGVITRQAQISQDLAQWCGQGAENLVVVFTVRGSGQPPGGWGNDRSDNTLNGVYFGELSTALAAKGYRVYGREADYMAASVDYVTKSYQLGTFIRSALDRRRDIGAAIGDINARCPRASVVLAAYSQGGIALRAALPFVPSSAINRVVAVDLFADASANARQDAGMPTGRTRRSYVWRRRTFGLYSVGQAARDAEIRAQLGPGGAAAVRLFAGGPKASNPYLISLAAYPATLRPRVDQYCHDEDPVCDPTAFAQHWVGRWGYIPFGGSGAPASYAAWKVGLHSAYPWRYAAADTGDGFAAVPRSAAAPAPAAPAPTSAPASPAAAPPAPVAPPPAPEPPAPAGPSWTQVTGGVTNTWTNYVNAGGTHGGTIPGQTAVQIACKVTGFRVADGNTWWYRIASPPWNGQFYASADAFYNNGATSGSLAGTPFMDPAVPDCAGSGGPGGVAETTGGWSNTWTNYTNAGGTQGPSIPGQATVTIACKLQGFRVADGNTWWYRIASPPWNGQFYASADGFYTNGATSGGLHGTPFVDGAVPDC